MKIQAITVQRFGSNKTGYVWEICLAGENGIVGTRLATTIEMVSTIVREWAVIDYPEAAYYDLDLLAVL